MRWPWSSRPDPIDRVLDNDPDNRSEDLILRVGAEVDRLQMVTAELRAAVDRIVETARIEAEEVQP